jgi:hypothetical protein
MTQIRLRFLGSGDAFGNGGRFRTRSLPLHCEPTPAVREAPVEPLPRLTCITGDVNCRLPTWTQAWPHFGPVHQEYRPRSTAPVAASTGAPRQATRLSVHRVRSSAISS